MAKTHYDITLDTEVGEEIKKIMYEKHIQFSPMVNEWAKKWIKEQKEENGK